MLGKNNTDSALKTINRYILFKSLVITVAANMALFGISYATDMPTVFAVWALATISIFSSVYGYATSTINAMILASHLEHSKVRQGALETELQLLVANNERVQ